MNTLQAFIKARPFGFITAAEMPQLLKLDPLAPLLVRCGACRFTCPAQDLERLKGYVAAGGDYIRDVAFPVGSFERAENWRPAPMVAPRPETPAPAVNPAPVPELAKIHQRKVWRGDDEEWRGDADPGL